MPAIVKKRGRPKGAEKTVIGTLQRTDKTLAFLRKLPIDRERSMSVL